MVLFVSNFLFLTNYFFLILIVLNKTEIGPLKTFGTSKFNSKSNFKSFNSSYNIISNIKECVRPHFQTKLEKRVEHACTSTTHGVQFLTNFEVFGNVVNTALIV